MCASPGDLILGEGPPQIAVRERDPEAVRAKGVEVTDFARCIARLAQFAAPLHKPINNAIPVACNTQLVWQFLVAQVNFIALKTGRGEDATGPELYVADGGGRDWGCWKHD